LLAVLGLAGLLTVSLRQIRRLEASEADLVFNKFSTDRSAEMVLWMERDGSFYYVNNAICARTGYRKEELLGRRIFDLCPDIDPRNWERRVRELGKLGSRRLSQSALTKFGETFTLDVVASIVEYAGLSLICVNARDQTAQLAAEAALRESETRYRSTVDSLHEGILVRDRERILACNPGAERIFGLPADRIIGRLALSPLIGFYEEDGSPIPAAGGAAFTALHTGTPQYGHTYRVQRSDDSSLWVEANAIPLFHDGDSAPYRVVATYADITERRHAELALHSSRERFRSMVNSLHEGVLVRDRDGVIVECNPAMERILGAPREVLLGKRDLPAAIYANHPDGSPIPGEERAWSRALQSGQGQFGVIYQLQRADGSRLWISSNAEPILVEGETTPAGVVTSHTDITTRRDAEIALRASEEKFAKVFDLIPELVTVTDLDGGNYVDMNEAWTPLTGFTRAEAIGHTASELNIWVDRNDRQRLTADVSAHGEVRDREISFRRKDGSLFFSNVSACIFEIQGRRLLMLIVRDITRQKYAEKERRAAEELLRHSEERFDIAVRNAEVGIWDWRIEEDRVHVSEVFRQLMGFAAGEPATTRVAIIARTHPDDRNRAIRELWSSVKQRRALDIEYRVQIESGGVRWLRAQGRANYGIDGRAHRCTGSLQDITERKRVEVALVESESKFREIFETSLDPIWTARVCDNGRIEYEDWNHAQVKALGRSAPAVSGKTPHELFAPATADLMLRRWQDCIAAGVPMSWEERWPLATGDRVWFSSVVPLRDAGGKVFRLAGIARDLTDRIFAEDSIRRLNEELEWRVVERTRELEIANRELEAFSYSVSHDLRAPLRAIDGFSALLAQTPAAAADLKARDYLPRIRSAALRMGRLIDDMLNLSRVGRHQLSRERFDLGHLAREVCDEIRTTDLSRNVRFEVEGDLQVEGDASLLRIALTNLIGNAWKFSAPKHDAFIKVRGERDRQSVNIEVVDNGVGFDPAYSARLFGAFQRLHNDQEFAGSGIGLAIVQRIVHRHGGEITASGVPGEGATFVVKLPLGRTASPKTCH
jgi:PAS domain S-box-containing protein